MSSYDEIAQKAEADLNTYEAKTGESRLQNVDGGIGNPALAESKFAEHGAHVEQGDELSTNAGYNKRIPPSEGGMLDDRGRQTRGEHFEGKGGPLDKVDQGSGANDNDVVPARVPKVDGLGATDDIATKGQDASQANVGKHPPGVGGGQYKGDNYYTEESVPGSISAEGWEAPKSVVEASAEAERPEKFGPPQ